MSAAQWTFIGITLGLTGVGTIILYPGVKKHAQSKAQSALASFMTAALFATPIALVCGAIVNALMR